MKKSENYEDPVLERNKRCLKYNPRLTHLELVSMGIGVLICLIHQSVAPLPKPILWIGCVFLIIAIILGAYHFVVKDNDV